MYSERAFVDLFSTFRRCHRITKSKSPFKDITVHICVPGSVVRIATDYGLDESRWGRDFPFVQTGPGAHPASCTMGTGSYPGVEGPGRAADPHPHLECRGPRKSRAIPLVTLRVFVAYKKCENQPTIPILL